MGAFQGFLLAGVDPANPSFVISAVNETVNQHPSWLNAGLKGKRKNGGCLMIKQLFFFIAKHWSCFILMCKSVYMQDANRLQAATEPHRTTALWGEIAAITLKTQICKPAWKAWAPPLLSPPRN